LLALITAYNQVFTEKLERVDEAEAISGEHDTA
jgi:hypothetical protein